MQVVGSENFLSELWDLRSLEAFISDEAPGYPVPGISHFGAPFGIWFLNFDSKVSLVAF